MNQLCNMAANPAIRSCRISASALGKGVVLPSPGADQASTFSFCFQLLAIQLKQNSIYYLFSSQSNVFLLLKIWKVWKVIYNPTSWREPLLTSVTYSSRFMHIGIHTPKRFYYIFFRYLFFLLPGNI